MSCELEDLLKDYKFRISKLELDWPTAEKKEEAAENPAADIPVPFPAEEIVIETAAPARPLKAPEITTARFEPPQPRAEAPPSWASEPEPAPTDIAPPPCSRTAKRRLPLGLALTFAAVLAAWGIGKMVPIKKSPRFFPLPVSRCSGLLLNDGRLFFVDSDKKVLLSVAPGSSQPQMEGKFSNPVLGGLAWADGRFWSTDPGKSAIYQHGVDAGYSIRRVYDQPKRHPSAIFSDGEYIWVADLQTEDVTQYLLARSLTGASLTPLGPLRLPGVRPAAILVGDGKLWVLDGATHKIFRYKIEGSRAVAVDWSDLSRWLPLSRGLAGMAWDGRNVWIAQDAPAALQRFEPRHLDWKSI